MSSAEFNDLPEVPPGLGESLELQVKFAQTLIDVLRISQKGNSPHGILCLEEGASLQEVKAQYIKIANLLRTSFNLLNYSQVEDHKQLSGDLNGLTTQIDAAYRALKEPGNGGTYNYQNQEPKPTIWTEEAVQRAIEMYLYSAENLDELYEACKRFVWGKDQDLLNQHEKIRSELSQDLNTLSNLRKALNENDKKLFDNIELVREGRLEELDKPGVKDLVSQWAKPIIQMLYRSIRERKIKLNNIALEFFNNSIKFTHSLDDLMQKISAAVERGIVSKDDLSIVEAIHKQIFSEQPESANPMYVAAIQNTFIKEAVKRLEVSELESAQRIAIEKKQQQKIIEQLLGLDSLNEMRQVLNPLRYDQAISQNTRIMAGIVHDSIDTLRLRKHGEGGDINAILERIRDYQLRDHIRNVWEKNA
ncbi:MAG: hypothetical protein WAU07_00025 [Microgenomates group bacterium]